MPSFERLKEIRESVSKPLPEMNRKQLYEDFSRDLWRAYKELMQKAAKMLEPDIGFLFQTQANFETGLEAWAKKRPEFVAEVAHYLRVTRSDWQNDLAEFRNYLEHKDEKDPKVFANRYDPEHAERLFYAVWHTIVDVLAMLISLHLQQGWTLVDIPEDQRHPVARKRFQFHVAGLADRLAGQI